MALVRCGSTCEDDTVQTSHSAKLPAGKIGTVQQPRQGLTRAETSTTPHFPSRVPPRPKTCTSTHPLTVQIRFCWKRRLARQSLRIMSKFRGGFCCFEIVTGQEDSNRTGSGLAG